MLVQELRDIATTNSDIATVLGAAIGSGRTSKCLGRHVARRPRGVTVSTLDSDSSGRGSNPREASVWKRCVHAR